MNLGQKDLPSKLTDIVTTNPNQHCIELYEFVLHSLQAYTVNLFSLPVCNETLSLYLLNNLVTECSQQTKKQTTQFSLKTSLSYDLLLLCGKLNASYNTKYLHSLFEAYEFFCALETRGSHSFVQLEMLLVELVEFQCSKGTPLKTLEDYLQDKKLYDSYSLVASQMGSKQVEVVLTTALTRLIDFYNEFTVFIQSKSLARFLNFKLTYLSKDNNLHIFLLLLRSVERQAKRPDHFKKTFSLYSIQEWPQTRRLGPQPIHTAKY